MATQRKIQIDPRIAQDIMGNGDVRKIIGTIAQLDKDERERLTEEQQVRMSILATLAELGKLTVTDDAVIFRGDKVILPASYEGRVLDAVDYLRRYHEAQENHYSHTRQFKYRPFDGANAFQQAMLLHFGTAGIGKATYSFFFGKTPPQMIAVDTGINSSIQVPWGKVEFPPLEAVFTLGMTKDKELGLLFTLEVDAPKKYAKHIAAFFELVERELAINSIYKGKAIDGAEKPGFLDLSGVDPNKVVYNSDVLVQMDANLWSLLRYTNTMRKAGLSLKRSILIEGTYGTGKTLAGSLTAQEAIAHGWTFILCRSGQDNLFDVLKTARLYTPAVVWFEDIDIVAKGGNEEEISQLLDALDGMQGKGVEVVAGFTTNHVKAIQKGVLRPGRLDAIIHIGELDASGYKKLVTNLIPQEYLGDIDYEALVEAFHEYVPAFVTEAVTSAMRFTIARTGGELDVIQTEDIVNAAKMLRPQFELMSEAKEGANVQTLDSILHDKLVEVTNRTRFVPDTDGEGGLGYIEDREVDID